MFQTASVGVPFTAITPDQAMLLLTVGILLIYAEMNRPGMIVPGFLGLLSVLFAVAALSKLSFTLGGVVLVASALPLMLVQLLRPTPPAVAFACTLALVLGLDHLSAADGVRLDTSAAVVSGVVIGGVTSILAQVARRARANKGLD